MAQTIWKGWLSFGLVSIPVRLHRAVEEKVVRFREVERGSGRRVHHRRVVERFDEPVEEAPATGDRGGSLAPKSAPVPDRAAPQPPAAAERDEIGFDQVVKGYELPTGEMVTLSRDELRAVEPEQTRTIDILEFVDLADID